MYLTPAEAARNMQLTPMDADLNTYGFPPGYFLIRSLATNRLLDVTQGSTEDGTEIILYPQTESSLVETMRSPESDNQVFFIDNSGHLCSRSSGHAVDVEDERLVIRHRRPVTHPFPNAYSHPLPRFSYDSETKSINVHFAADPAYHASAVRAVTVALSAWKDKNYLLSSLPLRRPRTIMDDASEIITSAVSSPITAFFGSLSPRPRATADEVFSSGDIDLREDEILEQDRSEEGEVDDSPEKYRKIRVVSISKEDLQASGEKTRARKQWEVIQIRAGRNRFSSS